MKIFDDMMPQSEVEKKNRRYSAPKAEDQVSNWSVPSCPCHPVGVAMSDQGLLPYKQGYMKKTEAFKKRSRN